jgi:hypothetical protein
MRISSLRKEGLMERLMNVSGIMDAAGFGTSREPIDDMKFMLVPHDCKQELLPWISVLVFVATSSFARGQRQGKTGTHRPSPHGSNGFFSPLLDRETFISYIPCVSPSIHLPTGASPIENNQV